MRCTIRSRRSPSSSLAAVAVASMLSTAGATASAQQASSAPTEPTVHVGWSDVTDAARPAAERELADAHLALRRLLRRRATLEGIARALATDARLREIDQQLDSIVQRAPSLVTAWIDLADVAFERRDGESMLRDLREAEVRAGDGPMRLWVLAQLGIAYTLLNRFDDARDAYRLELALPQSNAARAISLCNLAEIETYLHEPEASIAHYQTCVSLLPAYDGGYWGLASAYDREGREQEAREAAQRALSIDPAATGLTSPSVFYTPPYEVHYYLALAREAQGRNTEALTEWRRYLDLGGAHDAWAQRARAHVERLANAVERPRAPARERGPRDPSRGR